MVAFWNPYRDEDCHVARDIQRRLFGREAGWSIATEGSGWFMAYYKPMQHGDVVHRLPGNAGVVLGTVKFKKDNGTITANSLISRLDARFVSQIVQSKGRAVIDALWGSFVLLWTDPSGTVHFLRSPMSRLPCFHASHGSLSLLFSSVEDLAGLQMLPLSINWDSIVAQSAQCDYISRETGFNEVTTLESGECISVHEGNVTRRTLWDPKFVAESETIPDYHTSVEALRAAVIFATGALASDHDSILLMLSGGLDSSIVLAALKHAPSQPRLTCVNYFSPLTGDERSFAQSMAKKHATELLELERDTNVDPRIFLNCARTARPVLHFSGCDCEPRNARLARERQATAVFDGELGDNAFGGGVREEALIEHVQRHGVTPAFARIAMDYAILRRVSLWHALKQGLLGGVFASRPSNWSMYAYARKTFAIDSLSTRLVSKEALDGLGATTDRFIHPWLQDVRDVPAGKIQLIWALTAITSAVYHSPFAKEGDPIKISPLASQPVVDVALKIPTYFHLRHGEDRAVARSAFADELSTEVLRRGPAKGGPDLWIREVIIRNAEAIREILMDGVLASNGIIDRGKLETLLTHGVSKSSITLSDVFVQLYIEGWLRQWIPDTKRAAA